MLKLYDRTTSLIGNDNMERIKNSKILLIGVGGVGGICLETLVRSGFCNITIIDRDDIDETNINRQVISNYNNIGKSKVEVAKEFALSLNPECNIKTIDAFIDDNNIDEIFKDKYDYVIDAINNIFNKLAIYKKCIDNNIKFISSMGTAMKIDPTRLCISTLNKTTYDNLARKMRHLCVKNNIDPKKVRVVYSTEQTYVPVVQPFPVMMPVPSVAGIYLATYVINDLLSNSK